MKRIAFYTLLACGCAGTSAPSGGPLMQTIAAAADHNGVPRDLMVAIGVVEGGLLLGKYRMPDPGDHVPVAGVLELRHGAFNSLQRGAELVGSDELTLRADTDLATEAGARVLAELGRQNGARSGDLASWRGALEQLSGMTDGDGRARYADEVFTVLRSGGAFPAREDETIVLAAHAELPAPQPVIARASSNVDYPGAMFIPTSCTSKCDTTRTSAGGNADVHIIVIHDTEGGWSASVATLQNDAGKSVHYIVDADGSRVGQFVPETYTAWHDGNYYSNQRSIGIEHVGYATQTYQAALYAKSLDLVTNIRTRWQVPLDRQHVVGHYQVPDGALIAQSSPYCSDPLAQCEVSASYGGAANHRDPGLHWQWCQYMEHLGGACTCNDANAVWTCTTDKTEAVRCSGGKVEINHCAQGCVPTATAGADDTCNGPTPVDVPGQGGGGGGGGGGSAGGGGGGGGGSAGGGGGGGVVTPPAPNHFTHGGCSLGGDAPRGAPLLFVFFALSFFVCARRALA